MKVRMLFSVFILLIVGCTNDPVSPSFNEKQYLGIWIPFEIIYQDGTVDQGPFNSKSIFGVYDESVELKEDKTYTPLFWIDETKYQTSPEEAGKFVINASRLLLTEGAWEMEFEIVKLSEEELWVKYLGVSPLLGGPQTLYKLKRNIK